MRRKQVAFTFFVIGLTALIAQSFSYSKLPVDPGEGSSGCGLIRTSKPNGKTSHFFGLNCMSCHAEGRKGTGCFTVAGSVLDESRTWIRKNPTVKLYTEPRGGGRLVATIHGDALGNFFTTEEIDFGTGLYAVLEGNPDAAEPIKYMTRPLIKGMGKCNQCHGPREEALGID